MKYLDKEIITFSRNTKTPIIDFVLGNFCNYKCSYCFPNANTGSVRLPKINNILKENFIFLSSFLKKNNNSNNIKFSLCGGEPTLYHDVENLCSFLKTLGFIKIKTNASRTLNWWNNNYQNFDSIVISYHNEFSDFEHIKNVGILLDNNNKEVFIDILLDQLNFSKCIEIFKKFEETFSTYENVKIRPKLVRSNLNYVYSDDQKLIINNILKNLKNNKHKNSYLKSVAPTITLENNENLVYNNLINKDFKGNWINYKCNAPVEFLQIDMNGNIEKMSCGFKLIDKVNVFYDNLKEKFSNYETSIVCNIESNCGCIGLLESSKFKEK